MKIRIISALALLALAFTTFSTPAYAAQTVIKSTYGKDIDTGTGTCLRSDWSGGDTKCVVSKNTPNKFYKDEEEGPFAHPGF